MFKIENLKLINCFLNEFYVQVKAEREIYD